MAAFAEHNCIYQRFAFFLCFFNFLLNQFINPGFFKPLVIKLFKIAFSRVLKKNVGKLFLKVSMVRLGFMHS